MTLLLIFYFVFVLFAILFTLIIFKFLYKAMCFVADMVFEITQ